MGEAGIADGHLPEPPFRTGRRSPWGRLEEFRRKFDRVVFTLIDKAEADPNLDERSDILALLLSSRYEDGTTMSRQDVSDELLTCSARATKPRHPRWAGRSRAASPPRRPGRTGQGGRRGRQRFRQATILERSGGTVIDFAGRHVKAASSTSANGRSRTVTRFW